jgi:1-acyl-sn-glycerol-3-phosphate acyltransferase
LTSRGQGVADGPLRASSVEPAPAERGALETGRRSVFGLPGFHWWRTVFFLIPTIAVYTIVLGTLSLVSTLFDRSGRTAHRCARTWAWLILVTTNVSVRVSGGERLSRRQAYVVVSNHQSIYDIPVLFASLPFELRIIAKDSLGSFPFLGWHLRRSGHLLVNRRNPGVGLVKRLATLMRAGVSLIVFPEGTRSVSGEVGRFKRGIFLLAIQARMPIVPVSVAGSRHVMRKGRLMTCPGHVDLVLHPLIETVGLSEADASALAERVRSVVVPPVEAERVKGELGE